MTTLQIQRAKAISKCRFSPKSWEETFALDMARMADKTPALMLTPRQAHALAKLCWAYRNDIPKPLVPAQNPAELEPDYQTPLVEME